MNKTLGNDVRRNYTTAVSKGAGMIDETRRLLGHWRPGESLDDFARRVQQEGLLGGSTAYRVRDIVRRVFATRFLRPDDKPARILQKILTAGVSGKVFTELLFVYTARQDPLVYDFTIREFWPTVRRGKQTLDIEAMLGFLAEAHHDGRLDNQWSEKVSERIARCVLGLLRDIGFFREVARGKRELVNYRMSDEGVALLAWEMHESGITDSSLCLHPDWGLFGMTPADVVDRLDGIGEHHGVIVQHAGSVVHITWTVASTEEMVDVFTR